MTWLRGRLPALWPFACLLIALATWVGSVSCEEGNGRPAATPIGPADAAREMDAIVRAVENPDLDEANRLGIATVDPMVIHQQRLLDGVEHTAGVLAIRQLFDRGDATGGCRALGELLRKLLLNRLMKLDAGDASTFSEEEADKLDPDGLFLGLEPRQIQHVLYDEPVPGGRPEAGDVVSILWRGVTEDMIRLVYALGAACAAVAGP